MLNDELNIFQNKIKLSAAMKEEEWIKIICIFPFNSNKCVSKHVAKFLFSF